jgi:branched-chain amino acid transport system ATP-binding protein
MPALELTGLDKSYGDFKALSDVTISAEVGESLAIVGPNGAGKSTLFAIAGGQVRPTHGTVRLHGQDITRKSPARRSMLGLSRTFQTARLFNSFSVEDTMILGLGAHSRLKWLPANPLANQNLRQRAAEALAVVRLDGSQRRDVRSLTQGERKRLEFALALAQSTSVLMLDEPTAGMGAEEVQTVIAILKEICEQDDKLTLVFSSHDMEVVLGLASRVVVMRQGTVLAEGSPAQITRDERVIELYLGVRQ